MKASIILPAYREKNINKTLEILLEQSMPRGWSIDSIYVVACDYQDFRFLKNKKIKIIQEQQRKGKAHSINLALKKINSRKTKRLRPDIIVIQSADTLPKRNTIRNLLKPFEDPTVGMTCGRPMSLEDPTKFMGFVNHVIWDLHHFVSLKKPKVGEMFAFRNVIGRIPERIATDEAYMEYLIRKKGYSVVYAPDSIVLNRGAQNISDFIEQRRRIFAGHTHIKNDYGYRVSTMSTTRVAKALIEHFRESLYNKNKSKKQMIWLPSAMLLESYARFLGTVDFHVFRRVPYMWRIIKTAGR